MAKFQMKELVGTEPFTARLGSASGSANYLTDLEIGKPVKLIGDSLYNLAAVGDQIEGFLTAVEGYTADDYSIGSVMNKGRKRVTLDGLQATPGTGTCAVGPMMSRSCKSVSESGNTTFLQLILVGIAPILTPSEAYTPK